MQSKHFFAMKIQKSKKIYTETALDEIKILKYNLSNLFFLKDVLTITKIIKNGTYLKIKTQPTIYTVYS
jgi:hypothetical protein